MFHDELKKVINSNVKNPEHEKQKSINFYAERLINGIKNDALDKAKNSDFTTNKKQRIIVSEAHIDMERQESFFGRYTYYMYKEVLELVEVFAKENDIKILDYGIMQTSGYPRGKSKITRRVFQKNLTHQYGGPYFFVKYQIAFWD